MRSGNPKRRLLPVLAVLALVAAGCSSYRLLRQAQFAEEREEWDQAVTHYLDLSARDPGNARWRAALLRVRLRASQEHFAAGRRFLEAGVPERALVELARAVELDGTNQYARAELEKVRAELEGARRQGAAAPSLEELKHRTRDVTAQPPLLNPRSSSPISLDFPRPQSLFAIYRALGKAFGINVLFDPQLRDQQLAIELQDVTAQTALETLMRSAGHFYKVIDEQSILIAQDTQQNRRTYEDLVIQTFYLSNAEVKDAVQLLRSLISSRNIATNEQLNAVTIRDTADKVRIAQRIIQTIDKARSEVVVDIELIEVNTSKLRELGVSLSDNYRITQSLDLGEDVPIRLSDLRSLNQTSWILTVPSIFYDFLKSNSDVQLLAKPQIRVTEGERAKVRIGDQVPIPVTTFNSSQTVGGNIVPITSFQYKDVGINIDLEPRVHHNKEISLKLQIEVSQISGFQDAGGGQRQPIIGTRTIESTIRLEDGETNFLAGLIRSDEKVGETGVPGLSDIPVLGKLFSRNTSDARRTDVMLTLTPHIVRTADIGESDLLPIWVGTESNLTFRGGSPRVESAEEGPFEESEEGEEVEPEELEGRVRQRLEEGETEGEPAPEEAPGASLVPAGAPSDPFAPQPEEGTPEEGEEPPPDESALDDGDALPSREPAAPFGGVRLALAPSAGSLGPGELFEVEILVDAGVPISHLPSTISFDPRLFAAVRVDDGGFLGGGGASQVLADLTTPGTIVLGASRLGSAPGVAGSGTLARIVFRTLATGTGTIGFADRRVLDSGLTEVAGVETTDATVVVQPATGTAPVEGPDDR